MRRRSGNQAALTAQTLQEALDRVWPHVGPSVPWPQTQVFILIALQVPKGRSPEAVPEEESSTLKELTPEDHPHSQLGYFTRSPLLPTQGKDQVLAHSAPRCPSISLTGLQEPGGKGGGSLRPESIGQKGVGVRTYQVKVS